MDRRNRMAAAAVAGVVGVIALIVGIIYATGKQHPHRGDAGIAVGVVLLIIAGIAAASAR
jgi:peptidoglycan/LPS O-acetylase OafA/YrhL